MAWSTSERRLSLPKNWPDLIRAVKKRSGGRCEFELPSGARCPRKNGGGVDHITPNNDHSMSNLRDSCPHHHGKKSSAEGLAARAAKAKPVVRFPAGEHPRGML